MEKVLTVAQVVAPIFIAFFLGVLARKKSILSPGEIRGMTQFVIQFCTPCILFNSCLTASVGAEFLGIMALLVILLLTVTLWAFHARKTTYRHHNFPQLFCAKETGMLGIPLFATLFGTAEAYRMGMLDIAQALIAIPTISILASSTDARLSTGQIVKKFFTSPMVIFSLLGLTLNLTGLRDILNSLGIGQIITECTTFLGQPVSAVMLFTVGYNFSLGEGDRGKILKISAINLAFFTAIGILIQLALLLIPNVDSLTRWSVLMYAVLPASYIAPALGRTEEDFTIASGVCSILSILCLLIFCVIAAMVV